MQNKRLPGRFAASLSSPWRSRDTSYVLLVLSLIVFAKNFWLDEDAYIPFRSLAQLQAGHGAVWNMGERVQVTTSAAWYWLLAAVNVLLHEYKTLFELDVITLALVDPQYEAARILGDGTSGNIELAAATTTISILLQSIANFAPTVNTAG